MSFTLPNPSVPTNGQVGDATPILENEQAIAAAIANFDGSQINSKSIVENAMADSINPRLRYFENFSSYVESGLTWTVLSGLQATMTGGTIYVNGYRVIVPGVGSQTFVASDDTYVDIDNLGNLYYLGVSNNSTAPSLTANAIRIAKIVASGSAITNVYQAQNADGIGNIIYSTGPVSTSQIIIPSKFSVYRAASWTTNSGSFGLVTFDTKTGSGAFDTGNNYNVSTGEFVALLPGFYQFNWNVQATVGAGALFISVLEQNGGVILTGSQSDQGGTTTSATTVGAGLVQAKAGDYFQVFFYGNGGAGATGVGTTCFSGFLAGES